MHSPMAYAKSLPLVWECTLSPPQVMQINKLGSLLREIPCLICASTACKMLAMSQGCHVLKFSITRENIDLEFSSRCMASLLKERYFRSTL